VTLSLGASDVFTPRAACGLPNPVARSRAHQEIPMADNKERTAGGMDRKTASGTGNSAKGQGTSGGREGSAGGDSAKGSAGSGRSGSGQTGSAPRSGGGASPGSGKR